MDGLNVESALPWHRSRGGGPGGSPGMVGKGERMRRRGTKTEPRIEFHGLYCTQLTGAERTRNLPAGFQGNSEQTRLRSILRPRQSNAGADLESGGGSGCRAKKGGEAWEEEHARLSRRSGTGYSPLHCCNNATNTMSLVLDGLSTPPSHRRVPAHIILCIWSPHY